MVTRTRLNVTLYVHCLSSFNFGWAMWDALVAVCGLWCTCVGCNMPLFATAFTAMLAARGTTGRLTTRSQILPRSAQNSMQLNIGKAQRLERL